MPGHKCVLPGPMAVDFDSERNAEECADQDQARQYDQIVDRWIDNEGLDDIASDQELEAKQDAAAQRRTEGGISS